MVLDSADIYTFNFDDPKNGKIQRSIKIVFVNGLFSKCEFPFNGFYSRKEWNILSDINKKISELERGYEKKKD